MKRNHWLPAVAIAAVILISVPAGAVIVQPSDMQGWTYASQQGTSGTAPSAGFEPAPAPTPFGHAAFKMENSYSDTDPLSKVLLGTNNFAGKLISDITVLKYWTYIPNRPYDTGLAPVLELWTEYAGPNYRWFEWQMPYQDIIPGQWQQWDPMTQGVWKTYVGTYNQFTDWATFAAYKPTKAFQMTVPVGDLPLVGNATGTSLSIRNGAGKALEATFGSDGTNVWWKNNAGNAAWVDNFEIGFSDGTHYLYDFEVVPEPGSMMVLGTGLLGLLGLRRNRK